MYQETEVKKNDETFIDWEDIIGAVSYGMATFIPGISSLASTLSSLENSELQARIKKNERLLKPIITDLLASKDSVTQNSDDLFFSYRNIIFKYIGDSHVLDENLQHNLAQYLIECKDRQFYNHVVDFLLKTPVYKINGSKSINYIMKSDSILMQSEDPINTVIPDLDRSGGDMTFSIVGYSHPCFLNKPNAEILYHCLKLASEKTCPGIDAFIREKYEA